VDPGPIPLHCYYHFTFTRFIYILANYYLLPLDTLNPLFTATSEIDNLIVSWGKVLGCVVCRFHVAAGEKLHADKYPSAIVQSVAKLAGINLRKCGSFSYWFDNLGFTTEGKLAAVLIITLLLGFSNKFSGVNYAPANNNQAFLAPLPGIEEEEAPTSTTRQAFLAPLPGRKKISARGVSHFQSFTLLLFCFTLFLLTSFYQKYKNISSFIVVFTCLLLVLLE
jgi:hypothetical protein